MLVCCGHHPDGVGPSFRCCCYCLLLCALSGCCAPMLPLRGCRVSMRALVLGGEGGENSRRGGSHTNAAHSQAFITTEGSTGVQGDQLVFLDVVARHGVSVNVQFFSHHVSLRRSPRLSVVHECIHQMGLRTDNRLNLGCHQRRGGVWWRWRGRGGW